MVRASSPPSPPKSEAKATVLSAVLNRQEGERVIHLVADRGLEHLEHPGIDTRPERMRPERAEADGETGQEGAKRRDQASGQPGSSASGVSCGMPIAW